MQSYSKHVAAFLLSLTLILSVFTFLQSDVSASSTKYKVTHTNSLNIRKGPGTNYQVIRVLKKNTVVTQTSKKGNWSKIKVGSTTGYVSSNYLKRSVIKVSNSKPHVGKYYSITTASLNVRKTSAVSSSKLAAVKFGKQFIIKDQASNGWYKIEYKKGHTGYVSNNYGITSKSKKNVYPKGTIFGPLSGRIFVVDAGHGGSQNGAAYFGVKEKDINLKAAKTLQQQLIKNGAKVVMTRTTNKTVSLEKRVAISKSAQPDAFLSVHHNVSTKQSEAGYLALYTKKSERILNQYIFNALKKPIEKISTIPAEAYRYQNLYVLRENPTIGTLLEYGYMNRELELEVLDSKVYRQAMADGISLGLISYFNKYE